MVSFKNILNNLNLEVDGIYSGLKSNANDQKLEISLRELVASKNYSNYLKSVAKSHSIKVMDYEVERFLKKMPQNAVILDIGGCWGWHWRKINIIRSDIKIIIVDFVRSNLIHAKKVLGDLVGNQINLVHADATNLPFEVNKNFKGFNGVWSVQTFQHIPNFSKAIKEVNRLLLKKGFFINYSLRNTPLNMLVFKIFGKKYHKKGEVNGSYYLERASKNQLRTLTDYFGKENVFVNYSETLFHPDLKFTFSGKEDNYLGYLDILLSFIKPFAYFISRQSSFLCKKNNI
ncbi:MAG: SAM-dependent methyltransferase [Flavobacteriaceae bacterium]|nr:SAM-dependent methyltransferase [Flavobacteriaceae bacterium]|tara:strand:+ start:234 stop:1097 length:864 start_codon:yes stop_codon:yes gene_type:complete